MTMNIDLHVHCKERSGCGKSSDDEQIQAAIAAGLDALAFTDHDCLVPAERLRELNERYAPFKVFGGIEVSIWDEDFGYEHLLVLGVQDLRLESGQWHYPELHHFVHEREGFIAVSHPFRYNTTIDLNLEAFHPDGLELYSRNTPLDRAAQIQALAEQYNAVTLSNSDAHHVGAFGKYYNRLNDSPADERELVAMLQAGAFECVSPPASSD